MTHYAVDHGWDIYDFYCDEDYSGIDRLRPEFNRMLRAAEQKKFQIILCKSQSRFTRDMELVEKYIHGLFPLWGVRFIAVADNADTALKGNKKARQINGLVNEWYLEDLSENVRTVLDWKRQEGQYIGGSPLYGYRKDPADRNRLVIDPPAAGVVRQIYRWSLEGWGRQRIAHALNESGVPCPSCYKAEQGWGPASAGPRLWNKTTVLRILRNEMYTGVMIQGRRKKVSYKSKAVADMPPAAWFRVENTHEAIIDRPTFDAVQQGLRLRAKSDGTGEIHLLSGLVKCMDCGSTMSKSSNGKQTYLRCKRYADSGKRRLCTRHSIQLDALTALVGARIRSYVRACCPPEQLDLRPPQGSQLDALEQERRALTTQLEKRSRALEALYLDKVSGVLSPDQFTAFNRTFLAEKERLEQRLASLSTALAEQAPPSPAGLAEQIDALLALDPLPRELVTALVSRIEIGERDPDTGRQPIRISWNF